jgi:hypothetical protein
MDVSSALAISGVFLVVVGSWRGYAAARTAIGPFLHEGESTRTAVEATQRLTERARLVLAVRRTGLAIGWLVIAMYGLFLVAAAGAA